jgi:hypothetical protein
VLDEPVPPRAPNGEFQAAELPPFAVTIALVVLEDPNTVLLPFTGRLLLGMYVILISPGAPLAPW